MAAAANGGFFVTWTNASSGIDLTKSDAPGRVYSANGAPLGAKFHLSTQPSDGEGIPSVARLGNGNFITAWSDTSGGPIFDLDADIMGRVFKPNGQPAGGEFRINVTTGGFQLGTQSLALPDGRTLVVWHRGELSGFTDVDSIDLRGRFLNANGTPTGGELLLDTIGAGHNYEPQRTELVGLGNGGFALVWEEYVGPITASTAKEIHLQRFSPTGGKAGGEILIDRVPKDWSYLWISPVELANGGYAIVWRTFDPSDNPGKVFARVFDMKGAEIGHEVELTPIGNAGGAGLTNIVDLELMANGQVMAIGEILGGSTVTFATQIFDFGDERLIGTGAADKLYGKYGVDDQIFGLAGHDTSVGRERQRSHRRRDRPRHHDGRRQRRPLRLRRPAETGRTAATRDIIKDFVHNVDKIDLSTIDANGDGAGDAAFTFLAANGAAFTGAGGRAALGAGQSGRHRQRQDHRRGRHQRRPRRRLPDRAHRPQGADGGRLYSLGCAGVLQRSQLRARVVASSGERLFQALAGPVLLILVYEHNPSCLQGPLNPCTRKLVPPAASIRFRVARPTQALSAKSCWLSLSNARAALISGINHGRASRLSFLVACWA